MRYSITFALTFISGKRLSKTAHALHRYRFELGKILAGAESRHGAFTQESNKNIVDRHCFFILAFTDGE